MGMGIKSWRMGKKGTRKVITMLLYRGAKRYVGKKYVCPFGPVGRGAEDR